MTEFEETLLNMDVGDHVETGGKSGYDCVPGGWVYSTWMTDDYGGSITSCFIPKPKEAV